MHLSVLLLAASGIILALPALAGDAFGHGLGGDIAPPIDFGGVPVTVSTQLSPADITIGEIDTASMAIRFFDQSTDENLEKVTYRIEVWRSDKLLARNFFYDLDGTLDIDIRPVLDCIEVELWRCTNYYGTEHPAVPGALYTQGGQNPVISGPIFDKGGLYNIKVHVEGATSPRTLLTSTLSFDTFVSVAQEQPFAIQTAAAEVPVTVKTYYDDVENFRFGEANNAISFDMPFDWSPDYIDLVAIVHQELQIPKEFEPYNSTTQFRGFVDGVEVDKRVLILDPYTYRDRNVLHFIVTGSELQRINNALGTEHEQSSTMTFNIFPDSDVRKNSLDFYLVNLDDGSRTNTNVNVAWDGSYGVSDEIPFEMTFLDENGSLLRDVRYGYSLINHETGAQLAKNVGEDGLGLVALEGIDVQTMFIPTQDTHRLDIRVYSQGTPGLDFDDSYAGIGSALLEVGPPAIPNWIKGTVGLWVDGVTDDATFIGAIQFLVQEGVIAVPSTEAGSSQSSEVPAWIQGTAGLWVDGVTDDATFIGAIQFLIREGVIVV